MTVSKFFNKTSAITTLALAGFVVVAASQGAFAQSGKHGGGAKDLSEKAAPTPAINNTIHPIIVGRLHHQPGDHDYYNYKHHKKPPVEKKPPTRSEQSVQ
jgi:hypothetical protein